MEILVENISWIFSGVGVFLLGNFFHRKRKNSKRSIKITINSDRSKLELSFQNLVPHSDNEDC